MINFHEFVCLKEEAEMPQNQMPQNQMPQNQMPPGQNFDQEKEPPPEAAAEMEGITNDIQRQIHRLFSVLEKHNLNKQKTVSLLTTIIQQIAGDKLSKSNTATTARNAMANPLTPPPMGN